MPRQAQPVYVDHQHSHFQDRYPSADAPLPGEQIEKEPNGNGFEDIINCIPTLQVKYKHMVFPKAGGANELASSSRMASRGSSTASRGSRTVSHGPNMATQAPQYYEQRQADGVGQTSGNIHQGRAANTLL